MMQKMIMKELGPIKSCTLECNDFMVFTGPQASGKSTIAKSLFFFRSVKNILYNLLRKKYLLQKLTPNMPLEEGFIRELKSVFMQTFGASQSMHNGMELKFFYTPDIFMHIYLADDSEEKNAVCIDLSSAMRQGIVHVEQKYDSSVWEKRDVARQLQGDLNELFDDDYEVVYIPAGRSMITLLSSQLNYIYSSMDDMQKRSLDYCTQSYLEKVLQLKPLFQSGMSRVFIYRLLNSENKKRFNLLQHYMELARRVLDGEYQYVDGEERLQVSSGQYVKINFASSGQQEAVWILNILFYYLLNDKKTFFIIEEPESNLFPNAQKLITELIALVKGGQNQMLITTHSPYILGTINNLLYANKLARDVEPQKVAAIISQEKWLEFSELSAYYIRSGVPKLCMDRDFEAIENDVIDGASDDINSDFEKMVLLKESFEPENFK